jgi:hypothetical protein
MDGNHLVVTCTLSLNHKEIPTHALIDCRATGYAFIDQDFANPHRATSRPSRAPVAITKSRVFPRALPFHRVAAPFMPVPAPESPSTPAASSLDSISVPRPSVTEAKELSAGEPVVLERLQREQPVVVPERVQRDHPEPTPTQTQSTTKPSNNPISPETPFPWRNHTQCRWRIHGYSGPQPVEKSSYRMYPPRSPRNNRASLVRASALRGGLMS